MILFPPLPQTTVQPVNTGFSCTATGRPRPSIRWLRNVAGVDEDIVAGTKFTIAESMSGERAVMSVLNINPTFALDDGQYVCVVDNVVGSASSTATLTVNGKLL